MTDVTKVQADLDQANNAIKGLVAQLEASKQMCNEYIQSVFQLRTNLVSCQQIALEEGKKKEEMQKQINNLQAYTVKLAAELESLKPKVEEAQPDAA
jgi:uncharacterized coiled-coil DUF342 family protein